MLVISKYLQFNEFQHLTTLFDILNTSGKESRLVGGCVRDKLLNYSVSDIDVATSLLPCEVTKLLKKHSIKFIDLAIQHGTIIAIIDAERFEITTLRRDVKCLGRQAIVEYTTDFSIDAARRDFTINALSYDTVKHLLYDYHNGLVDLQNSEIKFIGEPQQRIQEDYLRILRFFRFYSRFGAFDMSGHIIDQNILNILKDLQHNLKFLSQERVQNEFNKILLSKNAAIIVDIMIEHKFLVTIDQRINISSLKMQFLQQQAIFLKVDVSLALKYAGIFSNTNYSDLPNILHDFKLPRQLIKQIIVILSPTTIDTLLTVIWFKHIDLFTQKVLYMFAKQIIDFQEAQQLLLFFSMYRPDDFPINGHDLLAAGYETTQISIILTKLRLLWCKSNCHLNKAQLMKRI